MALHAAEEETIESLKRWWQENGKQLVVLVIVVFSGYTGWLLWQNARFDRAEAASDLYEEILELASTDTGVAISPTSSRRILEAADELQADYSDSVYAQFAALFAAQQHVRDNDLEAAEASLRWILDHAKSGFFGETDDGLLLTANLRLGRVLLAQGEHEQTLALVNGVDPKTFAPAFDELRGDVYIAMGRTVDAREAYEAAQQAGSSSEALRMKLAELVDET